MKIRYVILLLLSSAFCHAQTTLTGGTISGTLTAAGSPYTITGDLTIPADSLLVIEPGVYMDFADTIKLIVRGNIKSQGTATQPITFTCSDSLKGWGGVIILNNPTSDTNYFKHCLMEYTYSASKNFYWLKPAAYPGDVYSCCIFCVSSSPLKIEFSKFRRGNEGVSSAFGTVIIKNSEFYQFEPFGSYLLGDVQAVSVGSSYAIIDNCHFYGERSSLSIGDITNTNEMNVTNCVFENIDFSAVGLSTKANMSNCTFKNNGCTALKLYDFTGIVDSCTFDGTYGDCPYGGDIRFFRDCTRGIIRNCVFKNNTVPNGCIGSQDGSAAVVDNCMFINNRRGIMYAYTTNGLILNSIFTRNTSSILTGKNTTLINTAFINNRRTWLHPSDNDVYPNNIRANTGAAEYDGGKFIFYNCIFWNNRNYYGDLVNLSVEGNRLPCEFYNCIVDGGTATFKNREDTTYTFTGTYQNCLETYPLFEDTTAGNYRQSQTCSQMPVGFNKGYTLPITARYQGTTYTDILAAIKDADGNARVWDDTVDIGPYETSVLASRIDVEEQPKNQDACIGNNAIFTAKANSLNLLTQWQKSTNGSSFTNVGNTTQTVNLSNVPAADSNTHYRVLWTNTCNTTVLSDTAILRVHTPQAISLGAAFTMPKDSTITLTANGSFTSYTWSTGQSTQQVTLKGTDLGNGTHTVLVEAIDAFGCQSSDSITITVVSGAGVLKLGNNVSIYPNPGSNQLFVQGINQGHYQIQNLTGALVQEGTLQNQAINTTDLPQGIYLITLTQNQQNLQLKWVKW
jgi:hypothetical protein